MSRCLQLSPCWFWRPNMVMCCLGAPTSKESSVTPLTSPRGGNVDYFSLKKPTITASPISFAWAQIASPKTPLRAPSVSSNSLRGSWSSLFNTGTMRHTLKEGLLTPSEVPPPVTTPEIQITTVVSQEKNTRTTDLNSSQPRKKRTRNNSVFKSRSVTSFSNPSRKTAFLQLVISDYRCDLLDQVSFMKSGFFFEPPRFNKS
jgi:hypothetical protein